MWKYNTDELYHYGVLGMKWGKRRTKPFSAKATGHKVLSKVYELNEKTYKKINPTLSSMNKAEKNRQLKLANERQKQANVNRRSKAKTEYEKHLSKNGGYIQDLKRYQTLPVSKMTKDKRYSEYYTFDRKRQTVVAKGIINDLGGTSVSSLTKADYEKGEQLVTKLTDDWRTNSSKMSELIS